MAGAPRIARRLPCNRVLELIDIDVNTQILLVNIDQEDMYFLLNDKHLQNTLDVLDQVHYIGLSGTSGAHSLDQVQPLFCDLVQIYLRPSPEWPWTRSTGGGRDRSYGVCRRSG